MSKFLVYILIGGLLHGWLVREIQDRCPDYEIKADSFIAVVALWPALFVSSLFYTDDDPTRLSCEKPYGEESE